MIFRYLSFFLSLAIAFAMNCSTFMQFGKLCLKSVSHKDQQTLKEHCKHVQAKNKKSEKQECGCCKQDVLKFYSFSFLEIKPDFFFPAFLSYISYCTNVTGISLYNTIRKKLEPDRYNFISHIHSLKTIQLLI